MEDEVEGQDPQKLDETALDDWRHRRHRMMPRQQPRRYALLSVNGKGRNHNREDEETERGASVYRSPNFSSSTDL